MSELERALREAHVAWPPTPDLTTAVLARIEAEPAPARPVRRSPARPIRRALAALLLLLAGAMAVEPARSTILDVLGLGGARIERRDPVATPQPPGARLGDGLDLGEPVTAAEAHRRAGFTPAPPAAVAGEPDAVYFAQRPPEGGRVSYLYAARRGLPRAAETGAGLLVTEMRASVTPFIEKAAGQGTDVERLTVDGNPAYFLSGEPHGFAYGDDSGSVTFEDQRLAGTTLLVERDGLLLRIEGRLSRARAAAIARSIGARP